MKYIRFSFVTSQVQKNLLAHCSRHRLKVEMCEQKVQRQRHVYILCMDYLQLTDNEYKSSICKSRKGSRAEQTWLQWSTKSPSQKLQPLTAKNGAFLSQIVHSHVHVRVLERVCSES